MSAIYRGILGDRPYEVKVLDSNDLSKLLALQEIVYDALPNKDILQPLSEDEFLYILEGQGLLIGAFMAGELIAFRAVLEPELDAEHLGYAIGLVEDSDLQRVLYQEISTVHPEFRGHGLQKTLAAIIMQQIDTTKYDYIAATVMPYNIASLKDKFSQGFYITDLKYAYGAKLRYVFALDLHNEPMFSKEKITLSMGDIEAQQNLLKKGFVGVSMKPIEEEWVIQYQKRV
ncbi:N-acetyltransferase [Ureibacillus sinduriensis]|uniref:Benzoate transporter n=1 Tax=Ureibacillus sinduriensis BLB-1 = JCM 15800 TaxID=1384057 RepID=A0A0A3HUB7_9BACL|nr:benzoate transporter [Ureibacillus sinduriensis]KGR76049.1 benzoate transporter [Ureibacillus sinduriensis BLB-1 = JCM 15800]